MDEWWSEIDDAVCACLSETGGTSPDEIGRRLGMSEEAAFSILSMLAQQGRVRISRAETVAPLPDSAGALSSSDGGVHGSARRR
jgi:DNA-binding transcriptional regulator LsrR (DeoR family)